MWEIGTVKHYPPLQPMSQWTSFADGVDQDQTAQNVQSDLGSTPSATRFDQNQYRKHREYNSICRELLNVFICKRKSLRTTVPDFNREIYGIES